MGLFSAYLNYRSSLLQSQTDKENAQLQYDASMKQIEAQKVANAEQQAFNKEEAELAFKRNSSKGQLQQLMDAGLSEMQARQIIAGGSAGSYTAAPSVNQNQGVDYTAPAVAQAAMNQASTDASIAGNQLLGDMVSNSSLGWIDSLYSGINDVIRQSPSIAAGVVSQSLSAADGGVIGNLTTAPLQGTLLKHINELPESARGSYAAFCSYASSASAPAWCKTADFQHQMQLATSSPMAHKALRNFFDTSNQLLTGETAYKALTQNLRNQQSIERLNVVTETYKARSLDLLRSQIAHTDADTDLLNQKIESEKLDQRNTLAACISQEMQNKLFKDQLPYITDATIAELSYMTSEIALKDNWLYEHSDLFLEEMTKTAEGRCAAAALAAMNDEGTLKRIQESSTLEWLVELHNGLKGAGFQIINSTSAAAGATGLLMKAIKVIPK